MYVDPTAEFTRTWVVHDTPVADGDEGCHHVGEVVEDPVCLVERGHGLCWRRRDLLMLRHCSEL